MADIHSETNPGLAMRKEIILCAGLFLLVLIVFWQVRQHDFILLDDDAYVYDNPIVQKGLSIEGVKYAFTSMRLSHWHPLTWLSHMLDVSLYGMNPGGHHFTNVLLHAMSTLLLYLSLWKMTRRKWPSFFVAALFAFHPLHVESVAWISGRKDVLHGFFWMLTLLSYSWYVERPDYKKYLLVCVCFLFGLLSKAMLITLPFVLLLLDFWPLHRTTFLQKEPLTDPSQGKPLRALLIEKIPLFILTAIFSAITFAVGYMTRTTLSLEILPMMVRIENAAVSYGIYLLKMLWPVQLGIMYPHAGAVPPWQSVSAGLFLIVMTLLAVTKWKRFPWMAVGWFWYMGVLVPVSGISQAGQQAYADRYTYISIIGIFILVTWTVCEAHSFFSKRISSLKPIAVTIIGGLILLSWIQTGYWKNSILLFSHTLSFTQNNFLIEKNLGVAFIQAGDQKRACHHFQQALTIRPSDPESLLNMGSCYLFSGQPKTAAAFFQLALKIKPDYQQARQNLEKAKRMETESDP